MTLDTTTLESIGPLFSAFDEVSVSQSLKTTRSYFTDGTTNENVGVSGYGTEFAGHYAKLNQIAEDRALWPENAEPPAEIAIRWAWVVIQQLFEDELLPTTVVASAEGGVAVCFVAGDKYADIECLNTGEILGVISNRRDRPSAWQIDQDESDIARATARISQFLKRPKT